MVGVDFNARVLLVGTLPRSFTFIQPPASPPLLPLSLTLTPNWQVVGTEAGRVFLAGKDGNVYELLYQAEDGWFRRKCRKTNLTATPFVEYLPSFLQLFATSPIIDMVRALENWAVDEIMPFLVVCAGYRIGDRR